MPFCTTNLTRSILDLQNEITPWYWILQHDNATILLFVAVTCKVFMLLLTNKLFKKEFYSILHKFFGYKHQSARSGQINLHQHNVRRPAVVRVLMV